MAGGICAASRDHGRTDEPLSQAARNRSRSCSGSSQPTPQQGATVHSRTFAVLAGASRRCAQPIGCCSISQMHSPNGTRNCSQEPSDGTKERQARPSAAATGGHTSAATQRSTGHPTPKRPGSCLSHCHIAAHVNHSAEPSRCARSYCRPIWATLITVSISVAAVAAAAIMGCSGIGTSSTHCCPSSAYTAIDRCKCTGWTHAARARRCTSQPWSHSCSRFCIWHGTAATASGAASTPDTQTASSCLAERRCTWPASRTLEIPRTAAAELQSPEARNQPSRGSTHDRWRGGRRGCQRERGRRGRSDSSSKETHREAAANSTSEAAYGSSRNGTATQSIRSAGTEQAVFFPLSKVVVNGRAAAAARHDTARTVQTLVDIQLLDSSMESVSCIYTAVM